MRNNKGFSLVELIVVIAIMAILAAVAIPTFAGFITKAQKASDDSFMADIEYAVNLANLATTDFDAGTITVAVGNDGITVKYGPSNNEVIISEANKTTGSEIQKTIANTIDWSYSFKNYTKGATIADGVVTPIE